MLLFLYSLSANFLMFEKTIKEEEYFVARGYYVKLKL